MGTTFRTLLDTVRKDLASTYVHDPDIELAEIAFLLGFSDQSTFSRAFRRWTGNSPSEVRKSGYRGKKGFNVHEQFDLEFQQSTDLGSFLLSKLLMLFQRAVQEEFAG